MEHFKPYEGTEPYIFISYSHKDSPAVMKVVNDMRARGYRIWYDEGIEVGSEWPECIAEHLYGAHLVIAFISPAYLDSDNCRREMHYTLSKKKNIINIFLANTEMTPGMEMQIGSLFALMKYAMKDDVFYERLYSAPLLNAEAFIGAAGSEGVQVQTARDSKDELVRRREELSLRKEALELEKREAQIKRDKEKAQQRELQADARREAQAKRDSERAAQREARAQLGKEKAQQRASEADARQAAREKRWTRRRKQTLKFFIVFTLMLGLTIAVIAVGYFTGWGERLLTKPVQVTALSGVTVAEFTEPVFESAAREFTGIASGDIRVSDLEGLTKLYIAGDSYYFTEEDWLAATETASQGALTELSDLAFFTGLDTLRISNQALFSLGSLPACLVEEFYLTDCQLSALTGISNMPQLRVLVTDGCPVNELGDINRCLQLRSLSLVGSDCADFSVLKPLVKLTDFSVSNCDLGEIATVRGIGSVTRFSFYNCDLRGRFFRSFDRERSIVSLRLVDCQLDSTAGMDEFDSLTELYLVNTGRGLDWTVLPDLSAMKTVYTDAAMFDAVSDAVYGSSINVRLLD